MSFEILLDVI